jgi:NAD(P)H-dependent FMN reductase
LSAASRNNPATAVPPSLAILGSARSDGHTAALLARLTAGLSCETIDLTAARLEPFGYAQRYAAGDPFPGIIERMAAAPVAIFATPVYWFSYSAVMKGFIDRFSDLVMTRKALAPRLRGRSFALLASGSDPALEPALNLAFSQFCDFFGACCIAMIYAREAGPFVDPDAAALVRREMGEAEAGDR